MRFRALSLDIIAIRFLLAPAISEAAAAFLFEGMVAVSRRRVLQGLVVSNDASTQELRSPRHLIMSKLNITVTTIDRII